MFGTKTTHTSDRDSNDQTLGLDQASIPCRSVGPPPISSCSPLGTFQCGNPVDADPRNTKKIWYIYIHGIFMILILLLYIHIGFIEHICRSCVEIWICMKQESLIFLNWMVVTASFWTGWISSRPHAASLHLTSVNMWHATIQNLLYIYTVSIQSLEES